MKNLYLPSLLLPFFFGIFGINSTSDFEKIKKNNLKPLAFATCAEFTYVPPDKLIDCNETPLFGIPIAQDRCCGTPNLAFTKKDSVVHDYCETRYYRTWNMTNSCGADISVTQIITARDTTSPTLIINDPLLQSYNSGDTIWMDCSDPILLFGGSVTATDNCDPDPEVEFRDSRDPADCSREGYFELMKCSWIAKDSCANRSTYTIYVARHDKIKPTIDCPRDFIVDCSDNTDPDALGYAQAMDDCDTSVVVTYRDDLQPGGCTDIILRKWTATDHCDNYAECIQTIKINDNEAPVISCPADRNYGCEADIAGAGTATATDDCKNANVTISSSDSRRDISDCHYQITRTWKATDACGNASTCVQTIIYEDTTAPTFTIFPSNMTVECNGSGNQTEANDWIADYGGATASDECGLVVNWDFRFVSDVPGCGTTRVRMIEFTISDDCGNSTSATASFIIEDTTAPDIFNPATDLSVDCDDMTGIQNWLDTNGGARASDICGGVTWSHDFDINNLPSCGDVVVVIFTATDDCGNTSTTTANFSIVDNVPPVITAGNNPIVECNDIGSYPSFFDWVDSNGGASATDNCSDASEIVWASDSPGTETLGCGFTKIFTVIFTATDECGNSTNYTGTFNVTDTTPPTIDTPAGDMDVACDGTGNQLNLDNWLTANAGASASDNCGSVTWTNDFSAITPGCGATGSVTVIFTATDECGNASTTTATFTVSDNEPPLLNNVPADIQIECDEQIPNDEPIVFDNCDMDVKMTLDETTTPGSCPQNSDILRVWTATDACGNTATASQMIQIRDTKAPEPTDVPDPIRISCTDAIPMTTAIFQDDCDRDLNVTMSENMTGNSCFGELIRMWTATDACGNSSTATQIITIIDSLPPTITCPADLTISCTEPTDSLSTGLATATDQCNAITFLASSDYLDNSVPCATIINRTWQAIDMCGNESSCVQKITITDDEAPVLEKEDPMLNPYSDGETVTFECDNVKIFEADDFSAKDNCSSVQNIVFENTTDVSDCLATGMISLTTYRWTAADDCGNSTSFTLFVKIVDTTMPAIDIAASDMSVACDMSGNQTALDNWLDANGGAMASDNCSRITWSNDYTGLTPNCGTSMNTGYATVTFTATDECGNTASTTATFSIMDNEAPVLSNVPANAIYSCSDNIPNDAPTVDDNCDANVTAVLDEMTTMGSCPQSYTITRTWTATDVCGNTSTASQVIEIQDSEAPSITCPQDADLQCGGDTSPAALGMATGTDNCGMVTIAYNDVMTGNAVCNMLIERTWTATDECGNASTCLQTISISDTQAPVFSAEAGSMSAECNATNTYPDLQNWLDANGGAAASDNCGNITWSNNFPGTETPKCGNTVSYSVTFTATDDCGNASQTTGTFDIVDSTPPNLDMPAADLDVQCTSSGNQGDFDVWINSNGGAAATDDCGSVTWTNDFSGTIGDCASGGTVTVTFTATDDCDNAISTAATFSITDSEPPVFSNIPSDLNLECGDSISTNSPTATDVCDADVTITLSENTTQGSCPQNYTLVRTWIATDDCGNSATTSQTIEIRDTQAPLVISVPAPVTIDCDAPLPTDSADFEDACDTAPTVTMRDSTFGDNCSGGVIRTWTATDACGNFAEATQIITRTDSGAPTINCPADATLQCGADTSPAALGSATGTDNCGNVSISHADIMTDSSVCNTVIERTWTATDDCGNVSTCVQTITITDSTPPSIDQAAMNQTVECNPSGSYPGLFDWIAMNGGATATDNCGNVIWTSTPPDETLNCGGTRIWSVTFTATDDCSNVSQTTGTYEVVDTQLPILISPAMDQIINCDGTGNQNNLDNWLTSNGGALAIDSCGSVTWTNDYTGLTSGCPGTGSVTVTFTATDDCGNAISTTATLSVTDNDPPILNNVPANITLQCSDTIPADQPLSFDNCDPDVTLTSVDSETPGSCPNAKTIIRTWTATDDCGNTATASQTIEIIDTTPPVVDSIPAPISISCGDPVSMATVTFTDNCAGIVTIQTDEMMTGDACFGELIRSWTATDACGNVSTVTQVVTIVDDVPPVITCPADITVECDMPTDTSSTGVAIATDFCNDINFFAFGDSTAMVDTCNSDIFRKWTAIDVCGNASTCVQKIEVRDTKAPVLTKVDSFLLPYSNGDTLTLECDALPLLDVSSFTTSDNCDLNPSLDFEELIEQRDCQTQGMKSLITCRWISEDRCGHRTEFAIYFKVVDTTPPVISCPADVNAQCGDVNGMGMATATDNCADSLTITMSDDTTSLDVCLIEIDRTWTAVDDCGNSSTCVQKITLSDSIAPTFMVVDSNFFGVNSGDTIIYSCDNVIVLDSASVIAVDNCDPNPGIVFHETIISSVCIDNYKIKRRCWYDAIDQCGNTSTFEIFIFVIDSVAPTIYNVPADTVVKCDAIPLVDMTVYADDNCDFLLPNLTFSESEVISAPSEKLITRTWSVADNCGNLAEKSQVIRAINCPIAMPNFMHFEAYQIQNSQVRLDWGIDLEMPYSHFYFVEHSIDNINFSNIGIVRSEDALNAEGTEFTFTHLEPHAVNNYYRIKFKVPAYELELLSETRAVLMNEADKLVYVYPNPVKNELIIELAQAPVKQVRYTISNVLGQVLRAEDFPQEGLLQRLDFSQFSGGTYFVTIYDLIGKPITHRIVKAE